MSEYKIISKHRHMLGESPVWDEAKQTLYWADLLDMKIYAYHEPTEAISHYQLNETIGAFGLAADNHFIVALRSGIYLFNLADETLTHIVTPDGEPNPDNRFNDGKIAPNGDFYIGTMDENFQENIAKLYCIRQDGTAHFVKDGFMVSNGLAWSNDGKTMYHSCSRTQKIWCHDFNNEPPFISNERVLAEVSSEVGRPDGAATDIDGCYWSAGVFAGSMNRFDGNGKLVEQIAVPMKAPTMPCFGGKDMSTLFITSLTQKHEAQDFEDYPLSGAVIAIKTNTKGVKIPQFNLNRKP